MIQGSWHRAKNGGLRVTGLKLQDCAVWLRVQGSGFRVQGSVFRVQGSGSGFREGGWMHAWKDLAFHYASFGSSPGYRGTSLIRNTKPPRITKGP